MQLLVKKIVIMGLLCGVLTTRSIDSVFEKQFNACWTSTSKAALFRDEIKKKEISVNDLVDFFWERYHDFTAADRSFIALTFLDNCLLDLAFNKFSCLLYWLSSEHLRIQCIETCIVSKKIFKLGAISQDFSNLFWGLSSVEHNRLAVLFLENYEDFDTEIIGTILSFVSEPSVKSSYIQNLLKSKNLVTIERAFVYEVCRNLPHQLVKKFLVDHFDLLTAPATIYLVAQLTDDKEREFYLQKLLDSKKCQNVAISKCCTMFEDLRTIDCTSFITKLIEQVITETCTEFELVTLANYLDDDQKKILTEKVLTKSSFTSIFRNRSVKGPLFSSYMDTHVSSLINQIHSPYAEYLKNVADSSFKIKKLTEMLTKLADFTEAEYKKGNIVMFHGQQSQWPFLEQWFNELCSIKYGIGSPKQFVRLRFTKKLILTDQEVQEIRKNGVTWSTHYKYRPKVLFSNLHVLANYSGSNSFLYVAGNSDQTVYSLENSVITAPLEKVFEDFGLTEEYKALLKKDNQLFEKLYKLYNELVKKQGNIGRLLAFSIPKTFAKKLAYSTTSGGPLYPITINGKETTDVVEIAEYFDQVPFANEYCIILSKEITSPAEAYKAEIKMVAFDAFDRSSENYKELCKQFDVVVEAVAATYEKLHPGMAEKIKSQIKNCVGIAAARVAAAA